MMEKSWASTAKNLNSSIVKILKAETINTLKTVMRRISKRLVMMDPRKSRTWLVLISEIVSRKVLTVSTDILDRTGDEEELSEVQLELTKFIIVSGRDVKGGHQNFWGGGFYTYK